MWINIKQDNTLTSAFQGRIQSAGQSIITAECCENGIVKFIDIIKRKIIRMILDMLN